MSENSRYYGDDTNFGIGIVEDINDPKKAGRVRVRIKGIHSPFLAELPVNDLPWSLTMMPNTSASISGEGDTPQLSVGSQVFGIFLDGKSYQQFLVVGTIPGISNDTLIQKQQNNTALNTNELTEPAILNGGSNTEKAFHFFIQYGGYSEDQAAGIIGNLIYESKPDIDPTQKGGLIKWEGDRFKVFKDFAASANVDNKLLSIQLSFILFELQTNYVFASKELINKQQPSTAAEAFAKYYIEDTSDLNTRKTLAKQAKAAYGSASGDDTGKLPKATIDRDEYKLGSIVESNEELLNIFKSAKKKREITELIIHDTSTYSDENVTTLSLDKKHKDEGFDGIQYHFLIQRNGSLQIGKDISFKTSITNNVTVDDNVTTVSDNGKQLIKNFESLSLTAYPDGNGYSIGYGHNNLTDPITQKDDIITKAQAEQYFNNDIKFIEASIITALNGTPINQNQFDAYASLAYNIGTGAFASSTTLKRFRKGDIEGAADAITLFNKVTIDGVKTENAGLTKRRNSERVLFLTPVSSESKTTNNRSDNSIDIAIAGGKKGSINVGLNEYENNYTAKQFRTLNWFIENYLFVWRDSNILGNKDINDLAIDPQFNVTSYVESKFPHKNKEDAPNNPVLPNRQSKIISPELNSEIILDNNTSKVELKEATPDENVTVIEAKGNSTVTSPGFNINLTPYLLTANFITQFKNQSILDLIDVHGTLSASVDEYILKYNHANARFELQAESGGGGSVTDEQIEDVVGAMLSGNTETLITVSYDDPNGKINFVVDNDLSNYDNSTSNFITASSTDTLTNKSGNISQWTNDAGYVTSSSTLTQEQVEDYAGALIATGGTKTLITVTYDDANNNMDFVVDNDLSNYDNSTSGFITAASVNTLTNKSGNISQWTNDSGYITGYTVTELDVTTHEAAINHDALTNFVSNEHIDHSTVSISAGTGLTGGGTIAANRTISLSHLGIENLTDPNDDRLTFWDDSAGAITWLTLGDGLSISGTTIEADISTSGNGSNCNIAVFTTANNIEGYGDFKYDYNNVILGIGKAPAAIGTLYGRMQIQGTNSSVSGPHISAFTSTDTSNPIFQVLNWNSDNINIAFSAYHNGTNWRSSDAGSNYIIAKNADTLTFKKDSGITVGSAITWDDVLSMDTSGHVEISETLSVGGDSTRLKLSGWTSSDSDISGLLAGSDFGGLIEGRESGHITIGIRENDSNDAFSVISGSNNYMTDTTYDKLIIEAKANGQVNFPGGDVDITNDLTVDGNVFLSNINSTSSSSSVVIDVGAADFIVRDINESPSNLIWYDASANYLYLGSNSGAIVKSRTGIVVGSPTGGHKGTGTVNAQAVYDDNSLLSCYVFEQYLDGKIDLKRWDERVPDIQIEKDVSDTGRAKVDKRKHGPLRHFKKRIGTEYDPLTLDGYAKHWKDKKHLTSMPNKENYDPMDGQMATGEWIQRLIETVEIQAIHIEQLNQRINKLEEKKD